MDDHWSQGTKEDKLEIGGGGQRVGCLELKL